MSILFQSTRDWFISICLKKIVRCDGYWKHTSFFTSSSRRPRDCIAKLTLRDPNTFSLCFSRRRRIIVTDLSEDDDGIAYANTHTHLAYALELEVEREAQANEVDQQPVPCARAHDGVRGLVLVAHVGEVDLSGQKEGEDGGSDQRAREVDRVLRLMRMTEIDPIVVIPSLPEHDIVVVLDTTPDITAGIATSVACAAARVLLPCRPAN